MSRCVPIDGAMNVFVGPDGRLLKNGRRKLVPETDKEDEPYIVLRSRTDNDKTERRYLKVLVFEHHAQMPAIHRAQLGPDDVELADPEKGIHVSNLKLTESGLEKYEAIAPSKDKAASANTEAPAPKKSSKEILEEAGLMDEEGNEISPEEAAKDETPSGAKKSSRDVLIEAGIINEEEEAQTASMPGGDEGEGEGGDGSDGEDGDDTGEGEDTGKGGDTGEGDAPQGDQSTADVETLSEDTGEEAGQEAADAGDTEEAEAAEEEAPGDDAEEESEEESVEDATENPAEEQDAEAPKDEEGEAIEVEGDTLTPADRNQLTKSDLMEKRKSYTVSLATRLGYPREEWGDLNKEPLINYVLENLHG